MNGHMNVCYLQKMYLTQDALCKGIQYCESPLHFVKNDTNSAFPLLPSSV